MQLTPERGRGGEAAEAQGYVGENGNSGSKVEEYPRTADACEEADFAGPG